MTAEQKKYFAGLDLIKLGAFLILSSWHYVCMVWSDKLEYFQFFDESSLWRAIEFWNRAYANSGQILLLVSSFLIGYRGEKVNTRWFYFFLLLGIFAFSLSEPKDPGEYLIEWDVYALLLVGFLGNKAFKNFSKNGHLITFFVCFLLTLIPYREAGFWISVPDYLKQVFIGDCDRASGQWPILPWVFFLTMFVSLGRYYAFQKSWGTRRTQVGILFSLMVLSIPSFFTIHHIYDVASNEQANCGLFIIPMDRFWAHFATVMLTAYICMFDKVNEFLIRHFSWLKKLFLVRNLWLAYFIHYILIGIMCRVAGDQLRSGPLACAAGILIMWVMTEGLGRVILFGASKALSTRKIRS